MPSEASENNGRSLLFEGRQSLGARSSLGRDGGQRSGIRSFVSVQAGGERLSLGNRPSLGTQGLSVGASTVELQGMSWPATGLLIVAEIMGVGILGVPGALHQLGWLSGVLLLVVQYPVAIITGTMLCQMGREARSAVTLGDLGEALFGRNGAVIGFGTLYVYMASLLGNFLGVFTRSGKLLFDSSGDSDSGDNALTFPMAAIGAAVLLPLCQIRTLHSCTALCALSMLSICVALALCFAQILASADGCRTTKAADSSELGALWDTFQAVSIFIFAFAGQSIFLEMIAEMKEPDDFPKALHTSQPVLLAAYVAVGSIAVANCGKDTPGYLFDVLPGDSWESRAAGGLVAAHTAASYVIYSQVLARALHLCIDPERANALLWNDKGYIVARLEWLAITICLLGFAIAFCVGIPHFEDIASLVGALLCTPNCIVFPCACYLRFLWMGLHKGPNFEARPCHTLTTVGAYLGTGVILLGGVVITIMGSIASVLNIISHAKA